MKTFYQRNFERTEHDDFVLNVAPYIPSGYEALPIYDEEGNIILGWQIQGSRE